MTSNRLIRIACAFACVAGTMMSAACDEAPPLIQPTPGPDLSVPATGSWELSGVAVGDDGRPIANTPVHVGFGTVRAPVKTDEMGRYQDVFDARQGGYAYGSTAVVFIEAGADYEIEHRMLFPTGSSRRQTLDLHPRRISWISAGEPVTVTVAPDDTPCFNNVHDGSWHLFYVCRTFRLVVPTDGVLTAEAVPTDLKTPRPLIEMEGPGDLDCCNEGNPLSIPVAAGMVIKINVEVLSGSPRQTFTLTTVIR
jgi:hypothetical protein